MPHGNGHGGNGGGNGRDHGEAPPALPAEALAQALRQTLALVRADIQHATEVQGEALMRVAQRLLDLAGQQQAEIVSLHERVAALEAERRHQPGRDEGEAGALRTQP